MRKDYVTLQTGQNLTTIYECKDNHGTNGIQMLFPSISHFTKTVSLGIGMYDKETINEVPL